MVQSKAPVPHFYITTEIAMERAAALREELQALPGAPKVTFTDVIVRATSLPDGRVPLVLVDAVKFAAAANNTVTITGERALEPNAIAVIRNGRTGQEIRVQANGDGTFSVALPAVAGDSIMFRPVDNNQRQGVEVHFIFDPEADCGRTRASAG